MTPRKKPADLDEDPGWQPAKTEFTETSAKSSFFSPFFFFFFWGVCVFLPVRTPTRIWWSWFVKIIPSDAMFNSAVTRTENSRQGPEPSASNLEWRGRGAGARGGGGGDGGGKDWGGVGGGTVRQDEWRAERASGTPPDERAGCRSRLKRTPPPHRSAGPLPRS